MHIPHNQGHRTLERSGFVCPATFEPEYLEISPASREVCAGDFAYYVG